MAKNTEQGASGQGAATPPNARLTANFTLVELTVTSRRMANIPNETEIAQLRMLAEKVLQPLRNALGKPVLISSAIRSEALNRAVGGTATSQRRLAQAQTSACPGRAPAARPEDRRARPPVRLGDRRVRELGARLL